MIPGMHLRNLFLVLAFSAGASAADLAREATNDASLPAELRAAGMLVQSHEVAEARRAFERILVRAPANAEANTMLALLACDAGEWEKALRYAGQAVATAPENASCQYAWAAANGLAALKAGLFSKLGYAKKCLAGYQRAAALEPRTLQYHWALLNYYQQAPSLAGGSKELAYAQAAEIRQLNAEQGRQAFTQLYVGEKKYAEAFHSYDEILRSTPDDYVALYQLGRIAILSGQRLDDGLAAFQRCLQQTPPEGVDAPSHANVHWRIGSLWELKQKPEAARAAYLAALQAQPDFSRAQQALQKLGPPKKA